MNQLTKIITAIILTIGVSACAQPGSTYNQGPGTFGLNKTTGGGILGGVGGAVAGSQFGKGKGQLAMTAVGTLLGAFIGSEIGASLDRADVAYANQTAQATFERAKTGQTAQWSNPDSGNYGSVTPTRTFQNGNRYCREYQQEVYVGGQRQVGYGTACRQTDGSWEIVR